MGVVIVGAGEAGVRAAFALREAGYQGAVTLLSEEPDLPYERPPLSKSPDALRPIAPEEAYRAAGIRLRLGIWVTHVDIGRKRAETSDGPLAYDHLLLATGAEARRLPGFPEAVHLRRRADAGALFARIVPGARLTVLGAGFIGMELAAVARGLGAQVTVLEVGPRILCRAVPAELAALLHARHAGEGVRIVTDAAAAPLPGALRLASGEVIAHDLLVAGVGSVPRTDLAERIGLEIDNGIVVDAGHQTSAPGIFAAGDCCALRQEAGVLRLESWRIARDQGEAAARAMLGLSAVGSVPYFWSDQYDLCLQVVGLPGGAPLASRVLPGGGRMLFEADAEGRLTRAAALGRDNELARDIKLAERLIAAGIAPVAEALADPGISLKSLLGAGTAVAKAT